jgi:cytochrome oxidase Cu insertion factor (SCO1/SenC/PrrC family)
VEQEASRETEGRFALWGFMAWLAITIAWWSLAFADLPSPPVWLARTREVCFGTLPNGLPDTWGWGSLIVSPLAVLGILLAVWGRELGAALSRLTDSKRGVAAVVLMAAVPLVGLHYVMLRVVEARSLDSALDAPITAEPLPPDYPRGTAPAPELGLIDQHGSVVTTGSLRGQTTLVTFAYGHCKTICPVVVNIVRQAAAQLAPEEIPVVVVSLDPWRDTPSSLPSLATAWKLDEMPGARVLSGEVDDVLAVLEAWNMPIQRDPQTGEINHPGLITILAPDGSRAYSFNSPPVRWVVEAARRVAVAGV